MPRGRGRRRSGGRRGEAPEPLAFGRSQPVEEAADGDWVVRSLTGAGSPKSYRCPGCDQLIPGRTPHVVTWPAYPRDSELEPWDTDSGADVRRHWHTACWRARDRRR